MSCEEGSWWMRVTGGDRFNLEKVAEWGALGELSRAILFFHMACGGNWANPSLGETLGLGKG